MVSKERFINGLLTYIDEEVIPSLPQSGRWGLGTLIVLMASRANGLYDSLVTNDFIKSLGIVGDGGTIDENRLADAISQSATKYGKLTLNVPMLGVLTFSADDVEKAKQIIQRGGTE